MSKRGFGSKTKKTNIIIRRLHTSLLIKILVYQEPPSGIPFFHNFIYLFLLSIKNYKLLPNCVKLKISQWAEIISLPIHDLF
ncbi:hypothetical protein ASZ90_018430 [hydrocarbon metagenome]|uniref:Uncharacterized protein n=1 Tax=hydrocarbon metagenome TaxID=938273 RepID=A0A0W8E6D5_9ZZZZ